MSDDRPTLPRGAEIEITPEMIGAAYSVLARFGVRDALEIDSDVMREILAAAFSHYRTTEAVKFV